jgi:hypothetical protein
LYEFALNIKNEPISCRRSLINRKKLNPQQAFEEDRLLLQLESSEMKERVKNRE